MSKPGKDILHRHTAKAFLYDPERHAYLILLKDMNKHGELECDLPGGGVEEQETVQAAVTREAWEEAHVQVATGSLEEIGACVDQGTHKRYTCFRGRIALGGASVQVGDEHPLGWIWVPQEQLASLNLKPRYIEFARMMIEQSLPQPVTMKA